MTTELQNRYPQARQFNFHVVVDNDFWVNAEQVSNQILRPLQLADVVIHYLIPCSGDGRLPVTHYGASGTIRSREAYILFQYYDALTATDVDSWILDTLFNRLWTKNAGWIEPPDGPWTYNQFLSQHVPPLQIIQEPIDAAFLTLYAACPESLKGQVTRKISRIIGVPGDYLPIGLSDTGNEPPTYYAGFVSLGSHEMGDIQREFPVDPNNVETIKVTQYGKEFWNNLTGNVDPPISLDTISFLESLGLQIIYEPVPIPLRG